MENNKPKKDKKEQEELVKEQLDKRLQELREKLREQKVALQKFLEQLNAIKEENPEDEN